MKSDIFERLSTIAKAINDIGMIELTDEEFNEMSDNSDVTKDELIGTMTSNHLRDIAITRDCDIVAYEITDGEIYCESLVRAYVAMLYSGESHPVIYRRERIPVDTKKDDAGYYANWDDECYEQHGKFSLFDEDVMTEYFEDIVQEVLALAAKVLPINKLIDILKDLSPKAKRAAVRNKAWFQACRDPEVRMIVIRFYWENFGMV